MKEKSINRLGCPFVHFLRYRGAVRSQTCCGNSSKISRQPSQHGEQRAQHTLASAQSCGICSRYLQLSVAQHGLDDDVSMVSGSCAGPSRSASISCSGSRHPVVPSYAQIAGRYCQLPQWIRVHRSMFQYNKDETRARFHSLQTTKSLTLFSVTTHMYS